MRGTSPRASPITVLKLGSEIPCQSRTREKIFLLLYINSVKNGENNNFLRNIFVFYKNYLYICNVLKINWSLTYLRLKIES